MSLASHAYKRLCELYGSVLARMRVRDAIYLPLRNLRSCSPSLEQLEPRLLLDASLEQPGLHLVDPALDRFDDPALGPFDDPALDRFDGQIYAAFHGEGDDTYCGPVTIEDIDIPAFAPDTPAGQQHDMVVQVLNKFGELFVNTRVVFTAETPPAASTYFTAFVNNIDTTRTAPGQFVGLAEQVDVGNSDVYDEAYVFAGRVAQDEVPDDYVSDLAAHIAHEAGHLPGYTSALDCGGSHALPDTAGQLVCSRPDAPPPGMGGTVSAISDYSVEAYAVASAHALFVQDIVIIGGEPIAAHSALEPGARNIPGTAGVGDVIASDNYCTGSFIACNHPLSGWDVSSSYTDGISCIASNSPLCESPVATSAGDGLVDCSLNNDGQEYIHWGPVSGTIDSDAICAEFGNESHNWPMGDTIDCTIKIKNLEGSDSCVSILYLSPTSSTTYRQARVYTAGLKIYVIRPEEAKWKGTEDSPGDVSWASAVDISCSSGAYYAGCHDPSGYGNEWGGDSARSAMQEQGPSVGNMHVTCVDHSHTASVVLADRVGLLLFELAGRSTSYAYDNFDREPSPGLEYSSSETDGGDYILERLFSLPQDLLLRHSRGFDLMRGVINTFRIGWALSREFLDVHLTDLAYGYGPDWANLALSYADWLDVDVRTCAMDRKAALVVTPASRTILTSSSLDADVRAYSVLHELAHYKLNHVADSYHSFAGMELSSSHQDFFDDQECVADALAAVLSHLFGRPDHASSVCNGRLWHYLDKVLPHFVATNTVLRALAADVASVSWNWDLSGAHDYMKANRDYTVAGNIDTLVGVLQSQQDWQLDTERSVGDLLGVIESLVTRPSAEKAMIGMYMSRHHQAKSDHRRRERNWLLPCLSGDTRAVASLLCSLTRAANHRSWPRELLVGLR